MENPYQAPAAQLEQVTVSDDIVFFPVSTTKLVVLSIFSFGLYELYWFYKNWVLVKGREKSNISPFWRAFFAFFTCHSLFTRISDEAKSDGIPVPAPGLLAAAWIILTILYRLPDPYSLISMLSFIPLIPTQKAINSINRKAAPDHDGNHKFGAANIAVVVIGGIMLALVIVGTFLPEGQA